MIARFQVAGSGWRAALAVSTALLPLGAAIPAAAEIEWGGVPAQEIVLFQPGQSSWEWNLTESDHSGGPKIRKGKHCISCHADEESKIGKLIVSGKKLEPKPLIGRRATIPLTVQAAYDTERLYLRLSWPENPTPSGDNADPEQPEAMIAVIFDDGGVKSARIGGCWSTCHDDAMGMPSASADSELTKYLTSSRTKVRRSGGGENYKSQAQIDELEKKGSFLEYWQARLGENPHAVDGSILKGRHEHPEPAVSVSAKREGGNWVVVLNRSLVIGAPGYKDFVPGKTYTVGFAVHDDYTDHRHHLVSFERTLVLGEGEADLVAVKR